MGRPISKKFFGNFTRPGQQIHLDEAWIPGEPSSSGNVFVISQKGTRKYLVRDFSNGNEGIIKLSNNFPVQEGEGRLSFYPKRPNTGNGFTISTPYEFKMTHCSINERGSGYIVGDVLTVVGGVGAPPAQILVNSVDSGGAIEEFEIFSGGVYTSIPTSSQINNNMPTGGSGSGASFKLNFSVNSVSFSGGFDFPNGLQSFVCVIKQSNGPGVGTIFIGDVAGGSVTLLIPVAGGYNYIPDSLNVINLEVVSYYSVFPEEYVRTLQKARLKTWNGSVYIWNKFGLANYPNSGLLRVR